MTGLGYCPICDGDCVTWTGCYWKKLQHSNSDGGQYTGVMSTPEECLQQCVDRYPHCQAVDYRLSDHVCYSHSAVRETQSNVCCLRYEYTCMYVCMYVRRFITRNPYSLSSHETRAHALFPVRNAD